VPFRFVFFFFFFLGVNAQLAFNISLINHALDDTRAHLWTPGWARHQLVLEYE